MGRPKSGLILRDRTICPMDYLKELKRSQRALSEISTVKCTECNEPLTEEEVIEAERNNIKRPICDDCVRDWIVQESDEHKHLDEDRFYRGY